MGDTVGIEDINGGIMTDEQALYLMEEAIFQSLKKKKKKYAAVNVLRKRARAMAPVWLKISQECSNPRTEDDSREFGHSIDLGMTMTTTPGQCREIEDVIAKARFKKWEGPEVSEVLQHAAGRLWLLMLKATGSENREWERLLKEMKRTLSHTGVRG